MGFALKKLSWILVSRGEKIISISQLRYKLFTKEMCWGTLGHPVVGLDSPVGITAQPSSIGFQARLVTQSLADPGGGGQGGHAPPRNLSTLTSKLRPFRNF